MLKIGTCVAAAMLLLVSLLGVAIKKHDIHPMLTAGSSPNSTCEPGAIHVDTDASVDTNCATDVDNSLCLCVAEDTWVALNNPVDAKEYLVAVSGGNAGSTTLTELNQYDPLITSLSETGGFDVNGCFTTNSNEVCYTCAPTIDALVEVSFSVDRETGATATHVMFSLGKGATGTIDDGSEFGEEYHEDYTINGAHSTGAMSAYLSMTQNLCVGLLIQVDSATPSAIYNVEAASLSITQPYPGFPVL